jgi:hypothetical protein
LCTASSLFFKGDEQYAQSQRLTALPTELQWIAPKTGIEPATRSSAYLRHLNILVFLKKGKKQQVTVDVLSSTKLRYLFTGQELNRRPQRYEVTLIYDTF